MHRSLLPGLVTALLASSAASAELQAQSAHPTFASAAAWDARLTPVVAAAAQPGNPRMDLSARWRRPVWVLPAAGAVVGGFAGLLKHQQLCSKADCSGPPLLIPLGAVAGAVVTSVLQTTIRRRRRN